MMKEEKEPIDIEFSEQNAENAIDFKLSDVKEEEDVVLANFIENLHNKLKRKFSKK